MINIDLTVLGDSGYKSTLTISPSSSYATLVEVSGSAEVLIIENASSHTLPENWEIATIIANGQSLQLAQNPNNPLDKEYTFNPYTSVVQIHGVEVPSLQIYGTQPGIKFIPPLLRPPYPTLLNNLPLTGTIQLNRSFEQHPSAQFELESTLSKSVLQSIFAPGGEFDLYGLPLRINSVSITELPRAIYPDARCKISVSFGGKWENRLSDPIFLRSDGTNSPPTNTPFLDPDCQSSLTNSSNKDTATTVAALFAKARITLVSPNLVDVKIDKDTPRDATTNPAQLLSERLRIANSFVRWSRTGFVEVVQINGLQSWTYAEADILGEVETSYEGIDKSSKRTVFIGNLNPPLPDLINFPSTIQSPPIPILRSESPTNLGFEYANVELTGEFLNPQEKVQETFQGSSKPRYVRLPSKKEERIEGDKNAHEPLEGVNTIKAMSLCFDIGGKTKTRTTVTEVAGTKIFEVLEIWGFIFTAYGIRDDSRKGQLAGNPQECWTLIKKTRTEYVYDSETGYLLYITEDGYNTVRYQQESADKPETLQMKSNDKQLKSYNFFRIPVISRTSYVLKLMPEHNTDGLFEVIKVCDRDGTSHYEPLINPDYAPPYYVEIERSESTAFASTRSPDNTTTKSYPDLIVGEESEFTSIVTIAPAQYQIIFDSRYPGVQVQGEQTSPQKFSKYVKKFKAEGQAIATSLSEVSIEEGTGDPPVAQRRSPLYRREEQSQPRSSDTVSDKDKYRYFIQTAGYSASDPVGGSESFSAASTLNEALTAAKCKLAIENWRTGLTERLQIPGNLNIAEGDRFNYYCNGEYRQRVVLSVQHTLNILGIVDGMPRITAITALTLGRYITPNLTYSEVKVPQQPKPPGYNIRVVNVIRENLGSNLDWGLVKSRRNF
jgi:hypothetical protein